MCRNNSRTIKLQRNVILTKNGAVPAFIFAATLAFATVSAQAAPVVILQSAQVASAVDGLVVDGITYNVTFAAFTSDTTFNGNAAGAQAAVSALDAALNGTTADFVAEPGVGSIDNFIVEDNGLESGIETSSLLKSGQWQNLGAVPQDNSTAVFTVASAPEPPVGFLLPAVGALAFALRLRNQCA